MLISKFKTPAWVFLLKVSRFALFPIYRHRSRNLCVYIDVEKIFERFHRVEVIIFTTILPRVTSKKGQATSRSSGGTGIGLALTKVAFIPTSS